jgi:NADH-quinone oxidoreductase subunit L
LFLGSGAVIHAVSNEQDMRKMGGLAKKIPYTYAMMIIGTLALTGVGIPMLIGTAGFYSKDAIIESAFAAHSGIGQYAFWMTVAAAFLTSFYSWRLIFMTFHGPSRIDAETAKHVHESPNVMLIPLYVVAVGALGAGCVFSDYFIGHDPAHFWGASLFYSEKNHILSAMHHVPMWVKLSPFVMMLAGFALAYLFYIQYTKLPALFARVFRPVYLFSYNKWYFDELYNFIFIRPAFWLGRLFWKGGDGKIIDGLGPDGVAARVLDATKGAVKMQTGYVYHYAFVMMIGLAAILSWFMFGDITGGIK